MAMPVILSADLSDKQTADLINTLPVNFRSKKRGKIGAEGKVIRGCIVVYVPDGSGSLLGNTCMARKCCVEGMHHYNGQIRHVFRTGLFWQKDFSLYCILILSF